MNRKKSIKVRTTMADYSKIKPIASKVGTSYYLKLCDDNGKSSLDYEHDNGFNVAIVRLYKKNANMSQAESVKYCEYYPYENAPIPINMKPDDLKKCTVRYR